MPTPTPQDTKLQVIQLHLQGHTSQEIASFVGISTGNVSNILAEFKQNVDEGEYQSLMYLGKVCKKNEVNYSQAFECISLSNTLKENKIESSKITDFLYVYLNSKDISPYNLAKYSLELFEISNQTDIDIKDIPRHHQSLLEESQKLDSEIQTLQSKKEALEKEIKSILNKKDLTLQILQDYENSQNTFKVFGLDIEDHKLLSQMIRNAKSENYNIPKIMQQISKSDSLDKQILEKEKKLDKKEKSIKDYDDVIESYKKDFSSIKGKLDKLNEEHKDEKRTINALKRLNESGVPNSDIVRWEHTRKNYDDPVEFDENLKDTKKHLDFNSKLQTQHDQLKSDNSKLQGKNNALYKEIKIKESELQSLDKKTLKIIEARSAELATIVGKLKSYFASKLDYHDITIRSRIDTGLTRFEEDLKKFKPELDEKLAAILKVYGTQQRLEFLEPIYKLFKGERVDMPRLYRNMAQLMASLELYLKTNKVEYGLEISVRNLKNEFTKLVEKSLTAS